jgi:hypothetical protein
MCSATSTDLKGSSSEEGVDEAYRGATIALSVICSLLLVALIGALIIVFQKTSPTGRDKDTMKENLRV